ncbi:MAG: hypothetical protein DIU61_008325 [Bacteroidota bacterium]|jgi:hypothetical protein
MHPKRPYPIISLLLVVCIINTASGQNASNKPPRSPFTDWKEMTSDPGQQAAILKAYGFASVGAVQAFNSKYNVNLPIPSTFDDSIDSLIFPQSGSPSSLSISNPAAAIDAVGTFIANRFKQEINVAFLNKLKSDLNNIPYLGEFFPTSKLVLQTTDPYNYAVYMETLREAFEKDVSVLPSALPSLISKIAPRETTLQSFPTQLAVKLVDIQSPPNMVSVITYLAQDAQSIAGIDTNLKQALMGLKLVVTALYKEGPIMFLREEELKSALQDGRSIYFGLLIKQNEGFFIENLEKIETFKQVITHLCRSYSQLADTIRNLQSVAEEQNLTPRKFASANSFLIQNLRNTIAALESHGLSSSSSLTEILDRIEIANSAFPLIVEYLQDKSYGLALLNLAELITALDSRLNPDQVVLVNRYLTFVGNLLKAKTKDELVQALETSANPVGSYRVKRNSTLNISVNAYGGAFGADHTYGATAPLGFYIGWGNINKSSRSTLSDDNGKSIGLFASVIDVGAIAAFRLIDGEAESPDVTWSNVFSPGVYASFGFGRCPVSLNIGYQQAPELTSVDSNGNAVFIEKEWQWRASIAIDIPIIDFYIKQRAFKTRRKEREPQVPTEPIKHPQRITSIQR